MSQPITTILFDLDETLSDHKYSVTQALQHVRELFPELTIHEITSLVGAYLESVHEAFTEFLANRMDHQETTRHRIRIFFKKIGVDADEEKIDHFLEEYLPMYMESRRATTGSLKTLKILRERGYKIGVITNGDQDVQEDKLKAIGADTLIDTIIASGAIGFAKPSPEIFAAALERLQSTKEETIMVGDNFDTDIRGGIACGMQVVLYAPAFDKPFMEKDGVRIPVISHMQQLLEYLQTQ